VGGSAQSIVNGMPKRGEPIPWKGSDLTPNLATSPDQTDDMRGGMGLSGVGNLQRFIEEGGLFVAVTNSARLPIDYGITSGVTIRETRQLQARGSIYNAKFVDRKSPIAYGYEETLPIYFNQSPLFQIISLASDSESGNAGQRPSGRGSLTDPDIVQAMPQASPSPPRHAAGEEQLTDEQRIYLGPFLTPPELRPRVVMKFAAEEKNLLVSGMLAGGAELANAPAVIDVPVGRGHVVFFANNPMWRHETQGSFFMLFNAAMNFDNLNAGQSVETKDRPQPKEGD